MSKTKKHFSQPLTFLGEILPRRWLLLSSTWKYFTEECERLREVFLRLRYPPCLLDSIFSRFINKKHQTTTESAPVNREEKESVLRLLVPFKSQNLLTCLRRQLNSLCNLVGTRIQPVFSSKKIAEEFRIEETKPPLVNRQCVVYKFQCDLCDAGYVAIHADTYTNALKSTRGPWLVNTWKSMEKIPRESMVASKY